MIKLSRSWRGGSTVRCGCSSAGATSRLSGGAATLLLPSGARRLRRPPARHARPRLLCRTWCVRLIVDCLCVCQHDACPWQPLRCWAPTVLTSSRVLRAGLGWGTPPKRGGVQAGRRAGRDMKEGVPPSLYCLPAAHSRAIAPECATARCRAEPPNPTNSAVRLSSESSSFARYPPCLPLGWGCVREGGGRGAQPRCGDQTLPAGATARGSVDCAQLQLALHAQEQPTGQCLPSPPAQGAPQGLCTARKGYCTGGSNN